jgi:PcfJ-like protein
LFTGLCAFGLENVQRRLDKLWHGNLTRLGDVRDYFQFVSDWCSVGGGRGIPNAFVAAIARTTLGHALVKRYPAMELIRQSECWHRIVGKRFGGTEPDAGIGWPALFPQPVPWDDLTVISLTTSLAIQQEGYRLQHCVGNYARSCLSGRSHIVSVRDASGASLSTAEIKLTRSYGAAVSTQVIQHRGMDNGEPPSSCATALHVAMKNLQSAAGQSRLREVVAIYQEQAPSFQHYHPNLKDSSFDPVMREVLPDFDRAVVWLERRLLEEEAWYWHHNESLWSMGTTFHVLTPLNNPQGSLRITYEVHDCWP